MKHNMEMEFIGDSLNAVFICACGLRVTTGEEALQWQTATCPLGLRGDQVPTTCSCAFDPLSISVSILASVNPDCPHHGEKWRRYREKNALFTMRYAATPEAIAAALAYVPPETVWQRFKRWWRG